MLLDIVESYSSIILEWKVIKFKWVGNSYQLICQIKLINQTDLFVRDYLFLDGSRKYSFHWQTQQGDCLIRWDNAPRHQGIETFPYHRHIGKEEKIESAPPMNLEKVLDYLQTCNG